VFKYRFAFLFLLSTTAILCGCKPVTDQEKQPEIAVSNSYLRSVVKDICAENMEVLSLAPPGMCPGHFDISPSQVNQLGNCRILLLFDFQEKIDSSMASLKSKGLKTSLVKTQPGMCIPDVYLATCREVCDILSLEFPDKETGYRQRLNIINERLNKLSVDIKNAITDSELDSVKVVSSGHQSEFINWLGLETVATFEGSDSETFFNITECLKKAEGQDVRFVIANKQEGTSLADSLAERLGIQTVVFGNFPESAKGHAGFDELLQQNVKFLLEAARK